MSSEINGPQPALAAAEQMAAPEDEQSLIAKLGNKLVPEQVRRTMAPYDAVHIYNSSNVGSICTRRSSAL